MSKTIGDQIAAAVKNTNPQCPFRHSFDPRSVEVSGTIPPEARGLFMLIESSDSRVKDLLKEISNLMRVMKGASAAAQAIMIEHSPELADRSAFVPAADWTFFATGPSEKRGRTEAEDERFSRSLRREQVRHESGQDVENYAEGSGPSDLPPEIREFVEALGIPPGVDGFTVVGEREPGPDFHWSRHRGGNGAG